MHGLNLGEDDTSEEMAWIEEMEEEDNEYDSFYNASVESIQVIQILLDRTCSECLGVSQSSYNLERPGVISSKEVIQFLECQTRIGFRPLSILKYAVELDAEQVNQFLQDKLSNIEWLQEVSYTKDISIKECSKALHPITTLFIIYRPKSKPEGNRRQTRSVNRGRNQNGHSKAHKTGRKHVTRRKAVDITTE